jgi:hypothetical protein
MSDFIRVPSEIARVDVYRGQALICRRGVIEVPAGAKRLAVRLTGLPRSLADDSVRARFVGNAPGRIADLCVAWDVSPRDRALRTASEEKLKALDQRRAGLEVERERLTAVARLVAGIKPAVYAPTDMPENLAFSETRPAAALTSFLGYFREQQVACRDRIRVIERELKEVADGLHAAFDEVERQSESDIEGLLVARKAAALQLDIDRPGTSTEVELSYVVPTARWVPEYELRVAEAKDDAELAVRALVAQRSGENWPQAELSFSTADLERSTELPKLDSWRIGKAQPPRKSGWRELVDSTAELFVGFDSGVRALPPPSLPIFPELPEAPRLGSESDVALHSLAEIAGRVVSRIAAAETRATSTPMARPAPEAGMASPLRAEAVADIAEMIQTGIDDEVECEPVPEEMAEESTPTSNAFGGGMPPAPSRSAAADERSVVLMQSASFARAARSQDADRPLSSMAPSPMQKRAAEPRGARVGTAPSKLELPREAAEPYGDTCEIEIERGLAVTKTALLYANLRMQAAENARLRGQLKAVFGVESLREQLLSAAPEAAPIIRDISDSVLASLIGGGDSGLDLSLPTHAVAVESSAGSFAARYDADSPAALPADGQLHAVTVARRRGPVRRLYACVPRVDTTVYQLVTFENPLDVPLLAGPVRIYRGGDFVVTAPLPTTPPKKTLTVNLGVEPGIAVARNTFFKESTGGLLGSSTNLIHRIEIEVRNKLASGATVQILERVPKSFTESIKVEVSKTAPRAEPYDQKDRGRLVHGGWRFELTLKPQEALTCTLEYEISISSKQVLVGGNRRD